MKEKLFDMLSREISNWIVKVWKEIKRDPYRKIGIIVIAPVLIHIFAVAIIDFSVIAAIGYYASCIYGFSDILKDPRRIVIWGVGYVIGSHVFPMLVEYVWPEMQKGTSISIFSGLMILVVVFLFWLKAKELKAK